MIYALPSVNISNSIVDLFKPSEIYEMDTEKRYQIIFKGEIVNGFKEEDVRKNLAYLFKNKVKQIDRLFTGQPIVIKKALDYGTAERYKKTFQNAGAVLRIELSDTANLPDAQRKTKTQEVPIPKGMIICPKCGFNQELSEECLKCGLIIDKYLEKAKGEPEIYGVSDTSILTAAHIKRKNVATIVLLISFVLVIIALFQKDRLPDSDEIHPELYRMPRQTQTSALAFKTTVGNILYTITPLYDYELYGLVVSYYDSTGWWDITHKFLWKDFINIKDICVLYGFNVRTDAYKEMRFKSGSWTCHATFLTERANLQFHDICLSNNHLLSDNKRIAKEVMRAKRGDQIYIKGYLAAYSHSGGSFFRGSSTSRTDVGDGACETIYIEDFKILKKANRFWRFVFSLSSWALAGSIVLIVISYGKEYLAYPKKKASKVTEALTDPGSKLKISPSFAFKKFELSVIIKLLFLLFLIYLWLKLH